MRSFRAVGHLAPLGDPGASKPTRDVLLRQPPTRGHRPIIRLCLRKRGAVFIPVARTLAEGTHLWRSSTSSSRHVLRCGRLRNFAPEGSAMSRAQAQPAFRYAALDGRTRTMPSPARRRTPGSACRDATVTVATAACTQRDVSAQRFIRSDRMLDIFGEKSWCRSSRVRVRYGRLSMSKNSPERAPGQEGLATTAYEPDEPASNRRYSGRLGPPLPLSLRESQENQSTMSWTLKQSTMY